MSLMCHNPHIHFSDPQGAAAHSSRSIDLEGPFDLVLSANGTWYNSKQNAHTMKKEKALCELKYIKTKCDTPRLRFKRRSWSWEMVAVVVVVVLLLCVGGGALV